MFQLMTSNGLVALVISREKTVEKLFHFSIFPFFCRSVLATLLQCRPFTCLFEISYLYGRA
jgi:hypothetical protein